MVKSKPDLFIPTRILTLLNLSSSSKAVANDLLLPFSPAGARSGVPRLGERTRRSGLDKEDSPPWPPWERGGGIWPAREGPLATGRGRGGGGGYVSGIVCDCDSWMSSTEHDLAAGGGTFSSESKKLCNEGQTNRQNTREHPELCHSPSVAERLVQRMSAGCQSEISRTRSSVEGKTHMDDSHDLCPSISWSSPAPPTLKSASSLF